MRGAGWLAAAAGVTLPSFIIISLIAAVFHNFHEWEIVSSFFYGVRPVVVGLILATALRIARQTLDARWKWLAAAAGLVIMFSVNVHPIAIVLLAAITGLTSLVEASNLAIKHDYKGERLAFQGTLVRLT